MTISNQHVGYNDPWISGDTRVIEVTVNDALTGATLRWGLFRMNFDPLFMKDTGNGIVMTDAENGVFHITVDPEDTAGLCGEFYHEVEAIFPSGAVHTLFTGKVKIQKDAIK
jgi:hypothetical protein